MLKAVIGEKYNSNTLLSVPKYWREGEEEIERQLQSVLHYKHKKAAEFKGSCLKQGKATSTCWNMVNLFMFYE